MHFIFQCLDILVLIANIAIAPFHQTMCQNSIKVRLMLETSQHYIDCSSALWVRNLPGAWGSTADEVRLHAPFRLSESVGYSYGAWPCPWHWRNSGTHIQSLDWWNLTEPIKITTADNLRHSLRINPIKPTVSYLIHDLLRPPINQHDQICYMPSVI